MLFWVKLFGAHIQLRGCCVPHHYGNVEAAQVKVSGGVFAHRLFCVLNALFRHVHTGLGFWTI
jgi:hypothetical protein